MILLSRIRRQLFRTYFRIGAHIHVRHWRGHGIHSPFMYAVVRQVFMKNRLTGSSRTLYETLRAHRISKSNSILLQNLFLHCRLERFLLIDTPLATPPTGKVFCILKPSAPLEVVASVAHMAAQGHLTVALLAPHRSKRRWQVALQIREHHPCVSVDRRLMMLYFFDDKLQPQHYRI